MDRVAILVVCTANVCRSLLVEALLARQLGLCRVDARVRSAGVVATGGPVHPLVVRTLRDGWGIDVDGRVSAPLDEALVEGPDLVVGVSREHVRQVVITRPGLWPRTFTLKELVRRANASGRRPSNVALGDWLDRLAEGRRRADLLGPDARDDIADPLGRPARAVRRAAEDVDDLVRKLVELAWPRPFERPRA